jgi:hypothetical protein
MSDHVKLSAEGQKLSRLERERKKLRIAQENINRLLAGEKEKQRKQDTRNKVLLGVILQGMIADGAISTELFEEALEKYLIKDKDKEGCKAFVEGYQSKSNQIDVPITKSPRKNQDQLEEIAVPIEVKSSTIRPPVEKPERSEEFDKPKPVVTTSDPKLAMFE